MEPKLTASLFEEIKELLKKRKIKYSQLALQLKMSESGLKKLLNSQDCSLSKIEKICAKLGVQVSDLIHAIEKKDLKEVQFTKKQELYFVAEPLSFLIYWGLVYERREALKVMEVLRLEPKKFWSLVRKLDHLELLKVMEGNRLVLPRIQGIRWVGRSKFVVDLYRSWGRSLYEGALNTVFQQSAPGADDFYFTIRYLQMSESTWAEFKRELGELEARFSNRGTLEMRMHLGNLRHVRWITAVDNKSWLE